MELVSRPQDRNGIKWRVHIDGATNPTMDQMVQTQTNQPEVSIYQQGGSNSCSVGNTINIHVQHFDANKFLENQYYDSNINHDVLQSLIPAFEKWRFVPTINYSELGGGL
uniref:Uncharacterized protein n=1 Tax=Strigamia maritima TaxID=126957 RepID=T1JIS3_STRMM